MEKTTWENPSSQSASRNFIFLADKKIDGVQSNYSQKHELFTFHDLNILLQFKQIYANIYYPCLIIWR